MNANIYGIKIGGRYIDTSVPSEPIFVVKSIQCDVDGKPVVAYGHYLGDSGPSTAWVNQLRPEVR